MLKKRLNNKKGFTLVELIVVIAILGILAAVLIPKITGFTASARASADDTNAKMLESVAKIIEADTGSAPTAATFTAEYDGKTYLDKIPELQSADTDEFYFNAGTLQVVWAADAAGAATKGGGVEADWAAITN